MNYVLRRKRLTPAQRFVEFHNANQHIAIYLAKFALDFRNLQEKNKCSINLLVNRLRWEFETGSVGGEYFIDSTFEPFYARLLMNRYPELEGFFETRRAAADTTSEWLPLCKG